VASDATESDHQRRRRDEIADVSEIICGRGETEGNSA
jgi:hypothetical protein